MPKPTEPQSDPLLNVGKLMRDFSIDAKIAELRKTIQTLEARITRLEEIKAVPPELGKYPELD